MNYYALIVFVFIEHLTFFICLIFIKNSFGDYFISSVLLMVLLSVPLVTDIFLIIICL